MLDSRVGPANQAHISEIFSSFQGEGLLVGVRQIFVRFSGCSLTCDYCDTPESRIQSSTFKVQNSNNLGEFYTFPNPVSTERLTEIINSYNLNFHHSISLTGGEPLEQVEFLTEWLTEFKSWSGAVTRPKIYLETNGILPDHLSRIVDRIDIIGMDIKLPSVSGVQPLWDIHREFLDIASCREVSVKVVVDRNVDEADIERAADIVKAVDPEISFVFQPRTPIDIDSSCLFHMQEVVSRKLHDVRVVPQVHKMLNIL